MKISPLFSILKWVVLLTFVILLSNCKTEPKKIVLNPAYINYVSAFTGEVVSNKTTIKVQLSQTHSAAVPGKALDGEIFSFSPGIAGQAYWLDGRTVEFRPEAPLKSGEFYKARFALSKLLEVPKDLETFVFQFQVIHQSMEVVFENMEPISVDDWRWVAVNGTVRTYDFADSKQVEEAVEGFQNGKKLRLHWNHLPDGKTHRFVVDSVERKDKPAEIMLDWNGDKLGIDKDGEEKFSIPAIQDFVVMDIRQKFDQTSSSVHIFFSDPLDEEQDIAGLIQLKPAINTRFAIEKNAIIVYPSEPYTGDVNFIISAAINNAKGQRLNRNYEETLEFSSLKPAVELLGKGNIIPSTKGIIFPFKAVNLKAVNVKIIKIFEDNVLQFFQINQLDGQEELKRVGRVVYKGDLALKSDEPIDFGRWNNFSIDLAQYVEADPGAIYRVVLSFQKNQSLYPCEETQTDIVQAETKNYDDTYWDDSNSYWYYYDFGNSVYDDSYNWDEREDPCKPSYYMESQRTVGRNILASDLGIIVKGGHNNRLTIAVTDIKSTFPLDEVAIEIYNFQQQLIESTVTNSDGFAKIDTDKKPFLLVAKKGKERGYLRLDESSALNMSMFDIGGQKAEQGLKGFIYGDRGVWRPGDSLYLSFMLDDREKLLPANHPVVFELYSPMAQLYQRQVATKSVGGIYLFKTQTSDDAPTGIWQAEIKVGGAHFSKSLKIETVKPNRLKIALDFQGKVLSPKKSLKGDLGVKWLHGAVAPGLKTDVEMRLTPSLQPFAKFAEYEFQDASKLFTNEAKMVFEGKTDANGNTSFIPTFDAIENAPGMLNAQFKVRAFEKGGDFSVDRVSFHFSPFASYVGVKIPEGEGWNGALLSDQSQMIPLVTVDELGNPVDRKGLLVEIFNIQWRWWWEHSNSDDLAQYITNRLDNLIHTSTINTQNGKAMFNLNLGGEYWGRKYIRITDPVSGHSCGKDFYMTYKNWNESADKPGGAEMLSFTTDKKEYHPGEKIKVNIPQAQSGRVLVSVEAGNRIINHFWVPLDGTDGKIEFSASEDMSPNAFINLTYIQPHNQLANDLPIRLFGVQPIFVSNPKSVLKPNITMPQSLQPETDFAVKVKEENGQPMFYTLVVVDDGLLDLTRFKTPDPWTHFNAKEALSVRTWDMYQYVMGAFTGKMAGLLALGGDENQIVDGGAKANRFIPVVRFLGPFELKAHGTNEHKIAMPNYVGSVRTMVVAKNESAYGFAEKTITVKKPLMVLPNLPRVLGPGEKILLPVTVFAMDDQIKNVSINLETSSLIKIPGSATQKVQFTRAGEQMVYFECEVAEEVGKASVKVKAQAGNEHASGDMEIEIRPSNPMITQVVEAVIEPGQSWSGVANPLGVQGTNHGVIEVSTIPPLNLENRLNYLLTYPHGCVEQTVSGAFPQLFLDNLMELSAEEKKKAENNVKSVLDRLRSFQIYSGGFSYWPGEKDIASDWGTSYAGHFMLTAKTKGYELKPGLLPAWLKFQKQRSNDYTSDSEGHSRVSNQLLQAYRLFTLALAGEPDLGAMNRLKTELDLATDARWMLAWAYLKAGKNQIAQNLAETMTKESTDETFAWVTYGSKERNKAIVLQILLQLNKKSEARQQVLELSKALSSDQWMSTQTTAFALMSLAEFVSQSGDATRKTAFEYRTGQAATKSIQSEAAINQIPLDLSAGKTQPLEIKNNGGKTLFVRVQLSGIPATGDASGAQNKLGMKVKYENLSGVEIDPTQIKQGSDFMVSVTVQNQGIGVDYRDMAITQIFPSGWEIRNMRMDEGFGDSGKSGFTYQDIRDDRVLTYFDLPGGQSKTFVVLLNASYIGHFYLPTVYCEAMYNNEVNARAGGRWISVVGE